MCVTSNKAHLHGTKVGLLINLLTRTHTLFYQNEMVNLASGPNCMILPILGEMLPNGLTDTTVYGKFMEEIVKQTAIQSKNASRSAVSFGGKGITMEKVGKYDIIIAKGAETEDIVAALSMVDENKCPTIPADLLNWYKDFYQNPQLLICCFDNADEERAQPIMVEFTPRVFEKVLLPGADSHDGKVPRIGSPTDRDHTLVLGVYGNESYDDLSPVYFSQKVPQQIKEATWKSIDTNNEEVNGDWGFTFSELSGFGNVRDITEKSQVPGYALTA